MIPPLPFRSKLRVRQQPHVHPERGEDTIVEVVRDGEVVATIYGSREGIHIVSKLLGGARAPFYFETAKSPSYVIPLLRDGEACPWCQNTKLIEVSYGPAPCPVCAS